MHELSLAQNIIDTVRDHVREENLTRVTVVRMEVGAVSGVVADSLQFAFGAIIQDTPLRNAVLESVIIPFKVHCNECGTESGNDSGYMTCGICDSTDVKILSGTDMILKQIELNDE